MAQTKLALMQSLGNAFLEVRRCGSLRTKLTKYLPGLQVWLKPVQGISETLKVC
jgi:hypothetical protein